MPIYKKGQTYLGLNALLALHVKLELAQGKKGRSAYDCGCSSFALPRYKERGAKPRL
jgi:hypothetical protein